MRAILADVRARGDAALRDLCRKFEQRELGDVRLADDAWRAAARSAPDDVRAILAAAAERIRRYHAHQIDRGFRYEEDGI